MKKIALIFPKDSEAIFNKDSQKTFGGATVQIYLIGKELSEYTDIKVYSLINNYKKINFQDGNKFNFINTFNNSDNVLKKILSFHSKIKKIKPDIIIQRGLTLFSCLLALYCRFSKIKFIFMFAHDREVVGRYQRSNNICSLFGILLYYSDFLICQTQDQYKKISKKYKPKSKIIYSGYEIKRNGNKKKEFILWVSRIEGWKRPDLYLKLAAENPDKNFVMISPMSPGYSDLYDEFYKNAESIPNLELLDFVQFNEIDDYFKKASVFINTSLQEGFPNTFIQACKNGIPVISLNVNPDDFIEKYSCGFFCNDDFYLMNESLKKILNDKKLYKKLSDNAYEYALEFHDIRKNVNVLMNSIYGLIK
ncbi:MAG: glycosyltransferase [Spirochaetes bacterium]|nr:glycosyltransferase [Spirochaetota bacterium]